MVSMFPSARPLGDNTTMTHGTGGPTAAPAAPFEPARNRVTSPGETGAARVMATAPPFTPGANPGNYFSIAPPPPPRLSSPARPHEHDKGAPCPGHGKSARDDENVRGRSAGRVQGQRHSLSRMASVAGRVDGIKHLRIGAPDASVRVISQLP